MCSYDFLLYLAIRLAAGSACAGPPTSCAGPPTHLMSYYFFVFGCLLADPALDLLHLALDHLQILFFIIRLAVPVISTDFLLFGWPLAGLALGHPPTAPSGQSLASPPQLGAYPRVGEGVHDGGCGRLARRSAQGEGQRHCQHQRHSHWQR